MRVCATQSLRPRLKAFLASPLRYPSTFGELGQNGGYEYHTGAKLRCELMMTAPAAAATAAVGFAEGTATEPPKQRLVRRQTGLPDVSEPVAVSFAEGTNMEPSSKPLARTLTSPAPLTKTGLGPIDTMPTDESAAQ